ncbi:hypothetical protein MTR67_038057 [Solanum verrucosum]|uniref:Uncharacterized protein n=1 Tax=Solanum verrucosum TaxID=315347 RepID=A0AAF0ZMG6_SOLVR|nr:hypothetical protein MTR67_038057 [Solanum verrucosum]
MASLLHFPTSHKLFFSSQTLNPSICIRHNHHFFLICRSKSKICASIKKPRGIENALKSPLNYPGAEPSRARVKARSPTLVVNEMGGLLIRLEQSFSL